MKNCPVGALSVDPICPRPITVRPTTMFNGAFAYKKANSVYFP